MDTTTSGTGPGAGVTRIVSAAATRQGVAENNADAWFVHRTAAGPMAAAVVDGIGHHPDLPALAALAAQVIARTGARREALPAILAAADLVADVPEDEDAVHDATAVAAYADPGPRGPLAHLVADGQEPGPVWEVAWVGDADGWSWDGTVLERETTPHNVGQMLRANGVPVEVAREHDNWLRTSLRHATVTTVNTVEVDAGRLLLLASDGMADHTRPGRLHQLLTEHVPDPATATEETLAALTAALVQAAEDDQDDYRDDVTVLALARVTR